MFRSTVLWLMILVGGAYAGAEDAPLKILFLGDQGPHQPVRRFQILAPVLESRGITMTYTEDVAVLNHDDLSPYDGLLLYANIATITPDQAAALLAYVDSGKGFIPLHCATFCFRNEPEIVALMGAQFRRHGSGVMTTEPAQVEHPILDGYQTFSSWDETYVHHLHNERDRTVLEYRRGDMQADGNSKEPWTWVRTHGQGRVFYTAWGHDERTWNNPGFQELVERGIRWACGQEDVGQRVLATSRITVDPFAVAFPVPRMVPPRTDVIPFDYIDVGNEIPNYRPSATRGDMGDPIRQMQQPLPPEESLKHMVTPEGFHVELFASEADFDGKPICMTWDERGRLWIAETVDYPNELQPAGQGRDRIRICEDTNGDGRADRFTVFADQLSIPTSIAFHRGGVIVQNGTETLYLRDTDGDDRADQREVLFTNWALGDTHGGVSNFQYGLDNWIWAMQGYNASAPERGPAAVAGDALPEFRMGFFRFRPDGSQLEFIRSTNNNTWGLGISEEGLVFGSTANRNPSVFMPIANRYYERVQGWTPDLTLQMISPDHLFQPISDRVRQVDHHGGYTAAAGHAIYTARAYPQAYWNRVAFVNGPTGKLVGAFVLEREGAGFRSQNSFNLLASVDEWTAPIMAEVGPDGNVWVIDWYNYIVQHNPTPEGFETGAGRAYVTRLRDKKHGRIYRVVHDSGSSATVPDLGAATPEQWVEHLKHPTMLVRKHAQRLLVERQRDDVTSKLLELIADTQVDEIGLNVGAIHALWTLHGLGLLTDASSEYFLAVAHALSHPASGVRRNAVMVLPNAPESLHAMLAAETLRDSDPQVVLASLLALADMQCTDAGQVIAQTLRSLPDDPYLIEAVTSAAAMHALTFLIESSHTNHQDIVSAHTLPVLRVVAEHFARGKPDAASVQALLAALAASDRSMDSLAPTMIEGLYAGWATEHSLQLASASDADVVCLFNQGPERSKGALVRLSSQWGISTLQKEASKITAALLAKAQDAQGSPESRLEAARQLIDFDPKDERAVQALDAMITQALPPELSLGLIRVISRSRVADLGQRLVRQLAQATPLLRDEIANLMLSRPELTRDLLAAVGRHELQISDLSATQRQQLSQHPDPAIRRAAVQAIRSSGVMIQSDRAAIVAAKMPLTERTGDDQKGKLVFMKHCSNCHVLHGEGKVVGPNLTGMSVHPKAELLTHILDPNRSVEANFRSYTVLTIDGTVISGVLATESRTAIEIIDSQAVKHSILRADIEQIQPSRNSAMPEGLETSILDDELVDLLEYLTAKGDYLPISIEAVATTVTTQGMFFDRDHPRERLVFSDWGTKVVEGVPFTLVDPQGSRTKNAIMLHGPRGPFAPQMPKSVTLRCGTAASAIHLLGGVAGWASKSPGNRGVSMVVRLHYADGQWEDHPLIDGEHIADYIGIFDVPKSKLAFNLNGCQLRYLTIKPKRTTKIESLELVKPDHPTAPVVMAITVQPLSQAAN